MSRHNAAHALPTGDRDEEAVPSLPPEAEKFALKCVELKRRIERKRDAHKSTGGDQSKLEQARLRQLKAELKAERKPKRKAA